MHRCACRMAKQTSYGMRYDECKQYVESDDQPYCDECIHGHQHHLDPNFDPVPANLLHTLRIPTIEDVEHDLDVLVEDARRKRELNGPSAGG